MVYSRIIGTGSYLPEDTLTNSDLERMVDTNDEWIVARTGIHTRHIANESETLNLMGFSALNRANESAGIGWSDYDALFTCCNTNKASSNDLPRMDYFCPLAGSVHSLLKKELRIEKESEFSIPFFDVSARGDATAEIVDALIADGKYRSIGLVHINALENEAKAEIYNESGELGRGFYSAGREEMAISYDRESRHNEMATLGCQALLRAASGADYDLRNIDLVIVDKRIDYIAPVSDLITERLVNEGSVSQPFFHCDITAGCTSFLVGLELADAFIRTGRAHRVAVLAPEKFVGSTNGKKFTAIVDGTDRATCVIFGDGAGAFIMQASEEPGILCTRLRGNGDKRNLLKTNEKGFVEMMGREIFKYITPRIVNSIEVISGEVGCDVHEVDTYVMHQANYRIIEAVSRRLSAPMEKFPVNIDRVGNTSAATIPLVTDEFIHTFNRGESLLFSSFGAGIVWGSIFMRY